MTRRDVIKRDGIGGDEKGKGVKNVMGKMENRRSKFAVVRSQTCSSGFAKSGLQDPGT